MKKFLSLVLALAMTMSLLAGCGGSSDTAADSTTDDTTTNTPASTDTTAGADTNQEAADLNEKPTSIVDGSYAVMYASADTVATQIPNEFPGGRWLYGWCYDTLFYSPGGAWDDITGLVATDWTVSEDGMVWTITTPSDVYFLNGNPMDADAIVRAIEYHISTGGIAFLDSCEVVDDTTIVLTCTAPTAEFMERFCNANLSIFDVQTWQENLAAGMDTIEAVVGVGTGPYYVTGYELGTSLTLTANADYWNADRYPNIETIYVPIISDASTQQTMLQSGEVDVGMITDWTVLENLVDNYGLNYVGNYVEYRCMWLNTSGNNEALTDPVVREALTMMIDSEEIAMALAGDYAIAATNCFNTSIDYDDGYTYDPEAGLALLATTGYAPEDITLVALSDSALSPIYANLQAQLALSGITVEFVAQDNSAMMSAGMSGDWDIWAEHGGLAVGSTSNIINILGATAAQKVVLDPVLSTEISDLVAIAFAQVDNDDLYAAIEDVCDLAATNFLYLACVNIPNWHIWQDSIVNYTIDVNGGYWMPWCSWLA